MVKEGIWCRHPSDAFSYHFFMSGLTKISQYANTLGYMENMIVSGFLLPLVIITEVFGGLAIILGWKTRYAALALAGFSVMSAILFHADFSNQAEMTNFMKNIAIAGGFLTLFVHGAGAYSLDNRANNKPA
ncbi:DoxX family protein [Shewanella sp. D64]|uniref:DoxX family protein n=1 Tax=unclassified Shewanella TaxID=196818 RepID=UPI0022BA4F1F|nr:MULTISPECIES: DoxX family protein [unclassified Shewanella]MEC4725037.1 DoxX family protein [Shewanella sp. D64]MEC4736938.1 DoxX family protein [Shewanella sp. E94]WBJ96533.1 DoxX family protein [Shewanella sp. MTB7]